MTKSVLALDGAQPAVPATLVSHDWERFRKSTQEEIDAVVEVLKSGHLSIAMGKGMPNAEGLEREFAEYAEVRHCLAVNSGTAALHCALAGSGVGPGDQVIVPAYTFIASAMAVLHQNAIPVFVDINPQTYLVDPRKIEAKITARTRAIMPVHVYGLPCDMDDINRIARQYSLKVIEDSAQGYGAEYKGRKTGALGDAAGFAMTTTKQLMTGEGGLMTTNDPSIYEQASMTRLFGERVDMNALDRAYLSESIGWNYKMPEMISALARVKLRHLDSYVASTQRNADYLTSRLKDIEGLSTPVVPQDRTHSYYLYPVRLQTDRLPTKHPPARVRDAVMAALSAENVRVARWQKMPVPDQPIFQRKQAYGRGCPWHCHGQEEISYEPSDFQNTRAVIEDHFVVRSLVPPNSLELMDCYAIAFKKVFDHLDRVLEIHEESRENIFLEEKAK
ncbi:MAG: DegT/DnrJ/EryC1/StrS family aminotransferase [Acidobacteria bacterium]|nr:DegT/DnrJ/EryC1/StrS family aminotransferase [Acidobacteriota bacterium]